MTTIYLVRHCEAMGNINRIFQGHTDEEISENGRLQLEKLAERFRNIHLDALYSSPLKRARRTAEAVNRHHRLPMHMDDRLMEINGGHWEEKPWAALPELYPDEWADWSSRPWLFQPKGGEAMGEVYRRMAAVLQDIAAAHPGQTVAAASHGCAIRNALCWAAGRPIEELLEIPWCDNTAVTILDFPDNRPVIRLANDNSHLDEELSTLSKQSWWRE